MAKSLPSPRQLLTSILMSLTTAPTSQQPINLADEPYPGPPNPLKNLPLSQRALLTTLHVLFPPPMLLQALDLLDRGLVLRVIEKDPFSPEDQTQVLEEGEERPVVHPPQANIHLRSSPPLELNESTRGAGEGENRKENRNAVYQVRSSQPPKSRFRDSGASVATGSIVYTVRLEAWNCSCAAFAFSAFPGSFSSVGRAPWNLGGGEGDEWRVRGSEMGRQGEKWEFGGLSFDGMEDGDTVPVCKHLVACLLGERWDVLGGYFREKEVSREEMGGVSAEG